MGLLALLAAATVACGAAVKLSIRAGEREEGFATFYHDSLKGEQTASGEVYDPLQLTAAHRHLPFGAQVRVHRISNGRFVDVRINDRGPFGGGHRIIDLSRAAAERLGMIERGKVKVWLEVLARPPRP
jgi:rare lipoprotein A